METDMNRSSRSSTQTVRSTAEEKRRLLNRVKQLPWSGLLEAFHQHFRDLPKSGQPNQFYVTSAQLASLLKYTIVYGRKMGTGRPKYDLADYINAVKDLWWAAERELTVSNDPETRATFLLRYCYMALPFMSHPESIEADMERAHTLYVICPSLNPTGTLHFVQAFQQQYRLPPEAFIELGTQFYRVFTQASSWTQKDLELIADARWKPYVPAALAELAASRTGFIKAVQKWEAADPVQVPYDLNPLLWKPIIKVNKRYYAPYPELIAYAVTKGLFFTCGAQWKNEFPTAFGDWFEQHIGQLLHSHLKAATIVSAREEEAAGYTGPNGDWTIVIGTVGLLIECKSSALFPRAKRYATPQAVLDDLSKNVVAEKKGLPQLHAKLQNILQGKIPEPFRAQYATVKTWYPILLLYDHVPFANAPLVMGNIIDRALAKREILNFHYQIWSVEELENLLRLVPLRELVDCIQNKWVPPSYFWGLNEYLADRYHLDRLRPMYVCPDADSPAYQIIQNLLT